MVVFLKNNPIYLCSAMNYRFKVWFEEEDEIIRWIDIKPSSTFEELHIAIQDAIGFDKKEPASFYISDDNWKKYTEITLADMGMEETEKSGKKLIMKNCYLKDFVDNPHQRFIYITDFIELWTLNCELQKIVDAEPKKTYPSVFKSAGIAPKQRIGAGKFKVVDDNEFDEIAGKLMAGIEPEYAEDDDDDDEEKDEFGFSDLDGALDDDAPLDGFHEENEKMS